MLNIKKGIERAAVVAAIYGVEGVGKTTLAASLPGALILDVENGSGAYDVARVTGFKTLQDLYGAFRDIISHPDEYKQAGIRTVVVDSVDAVENNLMIPAVLEKAGHPGGALTDLEWGRGYELEGNEFSNMLRAGDRLKAAGFNVVYIAHSAQKVINPPDNPPYSHYEIKLNKKVAALLKEKVDLLLFATYKTYLTKEGGTNKGKAVERVLICNHTAYCDAKNRFGLPETIPLDVKELEPIFMGAESKD